MAATLACVFALDRIVSSPCILSDNNPGSLQATCCARAKRMFAFAFVAAGCGECLHCTDIMPRTTQNMGALPKTAQLRLWRVARGTELLLSTWGAPCSRLRPDRRYAGVCALLRTARFPISCGMFSIAVLNLQERLLRRRSDGVNVSRVVSGIRCHRSGLLWRLCRHLSWFHNVRVLACTGRPYSGGKVLQQRHHA